MKKRLNLISAVAVFMLIGCGGSNKENLQNSGAVNAHDSDTPIVNKKLQRANWEGIRELTDGFSITDNEGLLSFKIKDNQIGTDEIRSEVVFIDTDNDVNTGYTGRSSRHLGAEYLIQGNHLFRYSGNGWNWSLVSAITRNANGDEVETEFNMNLIQCGNTIRAISGLADRDWNIIGRSEIVEYSIGNFINNYMGTSCIVNSSEQSLSISLTNPLISSQNVRTESIFIDADNNPSTGYIGGSARNFGAEYLIQGNHIFSYGGTGWSWDVVSEIYYNRDYNINQMKINLNREQLQLSNNIRVFAKLLDTNWQTALIYDIVNHTIKGNRDNESFTIDDNTQNLHIRLENPLLSSPNTRTEVIFIDVDNDPNTGYIGNNARNFGAEILIQGNFLYKYAGQGNNWRWYKNREVEYQKTGNIVDINVNKGFMIDLYHGSASMRAMAGVANMDWSIKHIDNIISHTYTIADNSGIQSRTTNDFLNYINEEKDLNLSHDDIEVVHLVDNIHLVLYQTRMDVSKDDYTPGEAAGADIIQVTENGFRTLTNVTNRLTPTLNSEINIDDPLNHIIKFDLSIVDDADFPNIRVRYTFDYAHNVLKDTAEYISDGWNWN